ncbi:VAN3-binding protein-like protein [Tanacetum coccineum]
MHISVVSPNILRGKWIKWAHPHVGILKLNTNGSSRNGMAACGGIIRDYKGSALVAFSTIYGPAASACQNSNGSGPNCQLGFGSMSLRGAVTLKARALNEVWNVAAVIPIDRGVEINKKNAKSSGYREDPRLKENFLEVCNQELLA